LNTLVYIVARWHNG